MDILGKLGIDLKKIDFFQKVIGINILVFLFFRFSYIFNYQSSFLNLFSLENNFFEKPWSIITYSFIHQGILERCSQGDMPAKAGQRKSLSDQGPLEG